ncbi:unnamed protein product [Heligmosomoides polygyrus]|uniref:Histone H4 n=1 Tax=Heligmosomoides polygyrus TaxID=6339 RepID=A0A183FFE2_HELPZ|nr:unnamed protein product [Heligmosomoides polygyrus]
MRHRAGGLRTGSGKRRHKLMFNNSSGISRPAIRRLARRAGNAVTYCEHARRSTVTIMDIVYALKRKGQTLYGFG